jgi:glycosyltransferase involved in cell wall biosynthesis
MKILIFNWRDLKHSWAGGGEIYIFEQAKRWVKMGHEVTVFCGNDKDKNLPFFETLDGIHIYRKGGRYSVYLWAIWYYFTKGRKDKDLVIDVQNGIPFFTPIFSRLPKISYVYHIHGNQFFYELPKPINYIGYTIERFIFPMLYRNTQIIAISKTTKKELMKINFPKENIHIVYCGINGPKIIKKQVQKSLLTLLFFI